MVAGIVACETLEWVEWQGVPTVVVHRFERAACEEAHSLPGTHPCNLEGQTSAQSVEEEALEGMVVERAVRVGDVEAVVTRVKGCVEVAGGVHEAVQEVLPCIDDEDGE